MRSHWLTSETFRTRQEPFVPSLKSESLKIEVAHSSPETCNCGADNFLYSIGRVSNLADDKNAASVRSSGVFWKWHVSKLAFFIE
jgi:hypothetical protein